MQRLRPRSHQAQSSGESHGGFHELGYIAHLRDFGKAVLRDTNHCCHLGCGVSGGRLECRDLGFDQTSGHKHRHIPDFPTVSNSDWKLHMLQPHQEQEGHSILRLPTLAVPKMPAVFGRQNVALYTAQLQLSRYDLKSVLPNPSRSDEVSDPLFLSAMPIDAALGREVEDRSPPGSRAVRAVAFGCR
ncbi:hypothetical protein [Variovorax beijingensis]|uniref:hypothetical protein n=1 Tax=Variovorax beijingensis TaxID=2496117 RepID=UPI003F69689D